MKIAFESVGVKLTEEQVGQFEKLLKSFSEYNSHTNLSAIRDEEGIVLKHFADSAALLSHTDVSGSLLDIGTGGGFPGIPLKILRPGLSVTLLDSVGKKIKACNTFITDLGLTGIGAVHMRAEEYAKTHAKSYDIVTSRATAYLPQILEWSLPFLKDDGRILLYKSPSEEEVQDGLKAEKRLKLRKTNVYEYDILGQKRQILEYRKA